MFSTITLSKENQSFSTSNVIGMKSKLFVIEWSNGFPAVSWYEDFQRLLHTDNVFTILIVYPLLMPVPSSHERIDERCQKDVSQQKHVNKAGRRWTMTRSTSKRWIKLVANRNTGLKPILCSSQCVVNIISNGRLVRWFIVKISEERNIKYCNLFGDWLRLSASNRSSHHKIGWIFARLQ